jgi:hypothetical protein
MRLPFKVLAVNALLGTIEVQLIHPETRAAIATVTYNTSTFPLNELEGFAVGQTYEYVAKRFL